MNTAAVLDRKTISITGKRQITIPQKFFEKLGFGREAECVLRGNEIVLRPVREREGGEFAEHILADLIAQGYEGENLLQAFKEEQARVRPAVDAMIADAHHAARYPERYDSYEDVFGAGDER